MLIRLLTVLLLMTCSVCAHAALVIQGSRVIYDEARGEASVFMRYVGEIPALLQVWMDRNGEGALPESGRVPFIVSPAVARLDPGNGQTIRILRIGDDLPQDRESLFYFNTLEVPPAPTELMAAGEAFMQFSIRGQFKFFYRPKGLAVSAAQAIELLRFSVAEPDLDGKIRLRIYNASPYHVTFSSVGVKQAGASSSAEPLLSFDPNASVERMVTPMGELLLPLEWNALSAGAPLPAEVEVDFAIINDAGGLMTRRMRVG